MKHPRDFTEDTVIYHSGRHPGALEMEYRENRWPRFWRATFKPDEPIEYGDSDGDVCRELQASPGPFQVAQYGATEAALMAFEGQLGRAARLGLTGI